MARRRHVPPEWQPLRLFVEMYLSHPKGFFRAGEPLGDARMRAIRRFREWHVGRRAKPDDPLQQIEVRSRTPTGYRSLKPDEYIFLDAETCTLYRRGWERWPGVEVRWVFAEPDIVAELVVFMKDLGVVARPEQYKAARAKFGKRFTARNFEDARRQLPKRYKLGPWGLKKSVT